MTSNILIVQTVPHLIITFYTLHYLFLGELNHIDIFNEILYLIELDLKALKLFQVEMCLV